MPNGNGNGARLDSWKDIASYLRRDVRTAIRWEREKGLPVRRVPGGQRKAVFAYTSELDAWLTHEEGAPQGLKPFSSRSLKGTAEAVPFPIPALRAQALVPAPVPDAQLSSDSNSGAPFERPVSDFDPQARSEHSRWPYLLAFLIAVAIVAAGAVKFRSRVHAGGASLPVRVGFTLNAIQAFDADGNMLWSNPVAGTLDPSEFVDGRRLEDGIRIADFRGDGDREILAVLKMRVGANATHADRDEVDMFSSRGALLWSYIPHGRLVFSTHDLKDKWRVLDVFVSEHEAKKQIWVAAAHAVWGHSFVEALDPETGNHNVRYVNSGTIFTLNELATPHGNFLLAGGFNNEYDSGNLAVIDESKSFAVSPQTEGTSHKCLNCPKGDPDYYFVFPRSEINELMQFYEDRVFKMEVSGDEIELHKKETDWTLGAQSLYVLKSDSAIRAVSVQFDTAYDLLHNKLEREGKLNHSFTNCPERLHPRPIQLWTPAGGWTEVRMEPNRASN